ncbi:branched-chain amino acid ABC transporter permease [Fictibacillus sp. FJAT-27399]|uniref:branched-chain amino acid ABC transporter permease n=1 Tax=Fictibacillus sp. FJAT-27399 TaxID=1729689 RepID=UPI0007829B2A|nr:branched-chain amino acid ABC transporter permease [Fictibacillus sp. FJAT-27399]
MLLISKIPKFYFFLFTIFLTLPFLHDPYYIDIVIMTLIWGAIASAWNISGGFAGMFSLGHAGYLGIGAYTSTLLFLNFQISPWISILIGGLASALFAFIIGVLCFRLKGPFYTLATISFAELIHISTTQLRDVTKGSMGLQIPFESGWTSMIFDDPKTYAYLFLLLLLIIYSISSYIQNSKWGYFLTAMREDSDAASSLGVKITLVKMSSTCLSAFLTGVCGTFLAQYILFIEPENVLSLSISIQIAMIAIVGGMGSAAGPIIGSILLTPIGILLRGYATEISGLHLFIYGLILVLVVLYMPNGIAHSLNNLFKKKLHLKLKWRRKGEYNKNVSTTERHW